MKVKAFALAGAAGSLFIAGAASAAFTSVSVEAIDNPTPGQVTYRVYANFDSMDDQLLAISGNPNALPFIAEFSSPLINDGGAFAGSKSEDFAQFPISGLYDSWLTIDADGFAGNDTDYSPGFLGNDGTAAFVVGTLLSDPSEGWFDSNPSSAAIAGPDGRVLIAQFTLASDGGPGTPGIVRLQGTADWQPGPGQLTSDGWVAVPAPGALALLGLAGLAGTRRRRA